MTRPIIPARANVMGLDVADKMKGMMRKMSDRGITHARSGARIIPSSRPYTAPRGAIGDALALAGFVACMMVMFGAGAAFAQRMTLMEGDAECVAYVHIENRFGVYNETETLETAHGPVSIHYDTIGGHQAGDDDMIEVVDLPLGLFARPMQAEIPDGETLSVCLFEFIGG